MAVEVERLVVKLEADLSKYNSNLAKGQAETASKLAAMEQSFQKMAATAKDLYEIIVATYRLRPSLAPNPSDSPEVAAERMRFIDDLRYVARMASRGLSGTIAEQEEALAHCMASVHGIIAGLNAAMLMREPSPSAEWH